MSNRIIIVLLVAAIALLLIRGCIFLKTKATDEKIQLLHENIHYKKELIQLRDEKDRLHTVINSYQATVNSLAHAKNTEIAELRNEVKRLKNLHSITRAQYQTTGTFSAPVIITDPEQQDTSEKHITQIASFIFQDRFLTLSGKIVPDSVSGQYAYRDQFTIQKEYKRKGLFKQPELIVSAYPENPAASFPDLQDITIQAKKKKWYQTKAFAFVSGLFAGAIIAIHNK